MPETRDQLGIGSLGILPIRRLRRQRNVTQRISQALPEDDRDADDTLTEHNHAPPSPYLPGTGRLVDKEV